jgi:signal transduction histidine kinase
MLLLAGVLGVSVLWYRRGLVSAERELVLERRSFDAIRLASERTQSLSRQLLEIQETDRRQLARELHDELGQALTATKINLQSLQRYPEPATIAARLGESIVIVDRALGQVRSLSLELRPPLLDDLGLAAALRWLADQHACRAELRVEFRSSAADARFDAAVETACFRVAQEALTNVVRHAGARHVTIELQALEDMLHLRVIDDGAGFDVPAARRRASKGASLGLLGMEERVLLAGGGIEWRSSPGQGAEVHAWLPLPRPAATHDETAATA